MSKFQNMVHTFHRKTDSTIGPSPALRDRELRARLIMEEAVETVAAMGFSVSAMVEELGVPGETPHREIGRFHKSFTRPDFLEVIDGLCDLLYVTFGTAVAAGVNLDPHFYEVHRANMEKLAGPKREDGKQLKPEGWLPPDHKFILDHAQAWTIGMAD